LKRVNELKNYLDEKKIEFRPSEKDFRCAAHGAEFDLNGIGKNKKGRQGLKIFQTAIEGNFLRITMA
jgi:nitrite reductase/ring-hydroxylating ferredoxin subunit